MAYCDITHVEARNVGRAPYSASTRPTASQVSIFIAQAAAEMDTALTEGGYSVPIATDVASMVTLRLQQINALGANYFIEQSAQVSHHLEDWEQQWEKALAMMRCGEFAPLLQDSDTSLPRYAPACGSPMFSIDMEL